MFKPDLSHVTQLMRRSIDRLQRDGTIKANGNKIVRLQDVFPFRPDEVEGIHYGENDSLRFQLRNGRVFDGAGKLVEGTPAQ
jgi:hypothetical protein